MDTEQHLLVASAGARSLKNGFCSGPRPVTPSPPKPGTAFLSQSAYSILVGQVLSVLVASTGAATTLLNQYTGNRAMPAAQNCPNYLIMALFLLWSPTRVLQVQRSCFGAGGSACSRVPLETAAAMLAPNAAASASADVGAARASDGAWWRYALLAIVDVEANVVAVWAYRYTSITSAMLLDCATIPFVMLLSCVILGAHYTWQHFAGALLCFSGVATIVLSDVLDGSTSTNGDDARGGVRLWEIALASPLTN
jgi:solute carrier family 35 protein F1/2